MDEKRLKTTGLGHHYSCIVKLKFFDEKNFKVFVGEKCTKMTGTEDPYVETKIYYRTTSWR